MTVKLSPSEQLAYSTVRIECELQNGQIGTGTGFFFRFAEAEDGLHVPAIVTNKHVIAGAKKGRFIMTLADSDGNPIQQSHHAFIFDNFEQMWIPHPEGNVDLCSMPIAPLLEAANKEAKKLFYVSLDKSLIPSVAELEDMVLMEEITMVGYPNGIWDQVNNMPIFRRGITATHPNLNYNGKPEFLIDAACFPGSSGSPVFLYNQVGYATKSGGMTIGPGRLKLLGVLYAGPQHTVSGEVKVITIPTQNVPIAVSTIPNNLGMVIKASKLGAFEKLFKQILESEKQANKKIQPTQ
ncbi:serine protease [Pseudidiomarina aestuarii]|uniref:Serine protease n=2 Tax=Pseudidiomarina aestuarii TaxID=624146 RepID=A0A2T4D5J6_9GAMM|nr:serine protease [Pseudidiomarina aestuarii]PTB89106.1 serine protease [Pseudidiomarina aestuarii]